jgi:Arc/MetJ-type ribon-helix-helix transcriptional regulator
MDMQNVTVSLPRELVRRARHVAVERGVSISRLVGECITRMLAGGQEQEVARRELLALFDEGLDAGVGDRASWTRDELNER